MTTCPRCLHEFDSPKGVQSEFETEGYVSENIKNYGTEETDLNPKASLLSVPRARVRGKARDYSEAFELAWKAYGRKEEKLRAYGEWLVQSRTAGSENQLLPQILGALRWQSQRWAEDGWKFAPYFERYLKYRKWEDEPPPLPVRRVFDTRVSQATDRKVAALRTAAANSATPEEIARAREESRKIIAELANAKAVAK